MVLTRLLRPARRAVVALGVVASSGCALVLGLDPLTDASLRPWVVTPGATGKDDAILSISPDESSSVVFAGSTGAAFAMPHREPLGEGATSGRAMCGRVGSDGQVALRMEAVGPGSSALSAAPTPDGLVVGGVFESSLAMAGATASAVGGVDGFVARVDALGHAQWLRALGSMASDAIVAVGCDGDRTYAAGILGDSIVLDPKTTLAAQGGGDAFVVAFDALGAVRWSLVAGDMQAQRPWALEVMPDGDVVVAGEFAGSMQLGPQTLTAKGASDAFVARLSGDDGTVRWAERFGESGSNAGRSLAVSIDGDIVLGGTLTGSVDFGGANVSAATPDGSGLFALRLDGGGTVRWARGLFSTGEILPGGVAIDPSGFVAVAGSFSGELSDPKAEGHGGFDAFVVALEPTVGLVLDARVFGSASDERVRGVATDGRGRVFLGGETTGVLAVTDAAPSVSAGGLDPFVASYVR
jgi:hypothetical protein